MKNRISDEVLKKILPKKLSRFQSSDGVYGQLKKMILAGKLKEGQRLVQEKLAHSLNVSRQPVLLAPVQLERDKLIVTKHGKGTFISFGNGKR